MTQPPTFTSPETAVARTMGATSIRFLLEHAHGAAFSVIEMKVAPGFAGPPVPHHHTREEASFLVLEGALVIALGATEQRVAAGGMAHLPRGVDFTWKNASADTPARFLCIYSPAGFERMFVDTERAFAERGGPPTPEAMREVMPALWREYGIEIARP